MIFSDISDAVLDELDDTDFPLATIMRKTNDYERYLLNRYKPRFMNESDEITANADDFTADFPDDMKTLVRLYLTDPQVYDMKDRYLKYDDFMKRFPNFATNNTGQANYWTQFGNVVRFANPLDVDHTFGIDYIRRGAKITGANSPLEIPDDYQEMVVMGVLLRCMKRNEDYSEAQQVADSVTEMEAIFIKNEGQGSLFKVGPSVIGSNRRRRNDFV